MQLHYCLGLINYHTKSDKVRALQDFEKFVESVAKDKFEFQQERAAAYIQGIKKDLSTDKERGKA